MYTVTIVDDESISQEIIQNFIETHLSNYRVENICSTGQEALETFKHNPTDIVLTDIRMPIMDGLTMIEQLNKISKNYIPIIISAYNEFEYAKSAMRLGVTYFLLKPLDFNELTQALSAAAHSVDLKFITSNAVTTLDDNQEMYMTNILSGKYVDLKTAAENFSSLNFPFSYEHACGIYIQVNFINIQNWIYGKEALIMAITNMINLLYSPLFSLPLFRKKESCNYMIVKEFDTIPDFSYFTEQVQQTLDITINVSLLLVFNSIEHLRLKSESNFPSDFMDENTIHSSINAAIAYMNEHYMEDLSRDDVAGKVYMSGAHFSRSFKIVTNTSYKDYLTEIRMRKAIELLKTNMKIQDIARKVGYPTPNRFNINFRYYTSFSPTEYRLQVLKMM